MRELHLVSAAEGESLETDQCLVSHYYVFTFLNQSAPI